MQPYKGYTAKIEFSADEKMYYGTINGIRDLVDFAGKTKADAECAFRSAVDEYIAFCAEIGKTPEGGKGQHVLLNCEKY